MTSPADEPSPSSQSPDQQSGGGRTAHVFIRAALIFAAAAWAIIRVAPQLLFYTGFDAARARAWPNPGLRPEEAYTRTSPIGPWIYKLTQSESTNVWIAIHVAVMVLACVLLAFWAYRHAAVAAPGKDRAVRLVILGPLVAVLVVFIGSYDPFTVCFLALCLVAWTADSRNLLVLAGIPLGLEHFEQGVVAVLAWAIASRWGSTVFPEHLRGLRSPAWILLGCVIGKGILSLTLLAAGVAPLDGRSGWVSDAHLTRISLIGAINFGPVLLMSLFAGLWAVVLAVLVQQRHRTTIVAWTFALGIPALLTLIALDHTRVFAITTLPLTVLLISAFVSRPDLVGGTTTVIAIECVAWIIVPLRVMTSPDGPSYIMDMRALDQWVMFMSHVMHGGW